MNVTSPPRDNLVSKPSQHELACREEEAVWFAERFKALADTHRLKILHLLMTRSEMCVCEIIEVLGLTQSNTSFHLNNLKQVRFIASRKVGKWVFYSLNRGEMQQFGGKYADIFDFTRWPEHSRPNPCDTNICERLENS